MTSFQKYETTLGLRWYFVTDGGINPKTGLRKQIKRRGFLTKKEAQVEARKIEQALDDGDFIDISNKTFNQIYLSWREQQKNQTKPSTHYAVGSKFKKHILPAFGEMKIQEISKTQCQKFIADLSKTTLSKRTSKTKKPKPNEATEKRLFKSLSGYKMYASQVFQFAVDEGYIKKNPMANVKVPKPKEDFVVDHSNEDQENFWDKEQVLNFFQILNTSGNLFDQMYFRLLIGTGARKAEALALNWKDIDFKNNTIHFGKTLYFEKGMYSLLKPKSKKSDRIISVDENLLNRLKAWRALQIKDKVINLSSKAFSFVFTREDGTPIRMPYPNERLNILIEKGNLPEITVHGLRHTHASLLFEAGASIKEVQERLGHSDATMTLNIYTHVSKATKESTAEKLKNFMQM